MPTFKNHPCPICGTVKYKKTSDSGLVCKYGHQMVGYHEVAGDEDAMIGVRMSRRKKIKTVEKVIKRLYGAELEDALKRLFQYCLQVMSRSFVQDLGFPVEFEYVVRELWILYLNDSKMTLINAHEVDKNVNGHNAGGDTNNTFMAFDEDPEDLLQEPSSDSDSDNDNNNNNSNSNSNSNRPLNDTHLNSNNNDTNNTASGSNTSTSTSATATTTTTTTTTSKKKKKRKMAGTEWQRLRFRHLLVFCYLGCMYLGWPVTLSDIRRWCATLRLPYLHLLKNLPTETLELVDLRSMIHLLQLPPIELMQKDTLSFTAAFISRTSVLLPKPNAPLLIYRYCTQLFLPVEMYFCARTMYEEYPYPEREKQKQTPSNNYHNFDSHIMVIVLVLAKLCYGLDDVEDIDPVYHNLILPPPLPKQVWLEHVRANADRWEHIYQTKMTDSPDIELDLIVDYLKNSLPEDKHRKHEKKSLVRRHISRMQNSLESNTTRRSEWSDGLLVDTPKLTSTIHATNSVSAGSDGGGTRTKVVGDAYRTLKKHAKAKGKMVFPHEEELVLQLASRILGCKPQTVQARLVTYENYLKKL